jgi:hypothetical protein
MKTSRVAIVAVKRCARGLAGDWRFFSKIEVDTVSSSDPKYQNVEFEIKAKMPITAKFRPVHDVDVSWTAKLPKDSDEAAPQLAPGTLTTTFKPKPGC